MFKANGNRLFTIGIVISYGGLALQGRQRRSCDDLQGWIFYANNV